MTPLVSILIPAFNSAATIAQTLRSALGQSWPNKEIIVIDDGSSDHTVEIARSFGSRWVAVATGPNRGAAAARNRALAVAEGEFIQWLDADDLLGRDKIALQMEAALACPSRRTLFSGPWGSFAYRPRKAKFVPTSLWRDLSPAKFLLRKMEGNVYLTNASWLTSRQLCEAAGPWDTQVRHDDDGVYYCKVLKAADGIRFVPGARMFYRRRASASQSYLGGRSAPKLDSLHRSLRVHIDTLLSLDGSARAKRACIKLLQSYLFAFYPVRPDLLREQFRWAEELGTTLVLPSLGGKYAWLEPLFGYRIARRAQALLPRLKQGFYSSWDKILYELEREKSLPV